MKNETGDVVMIAVTICSIAAFVGILIYTVMFGKNMFSSEADKLTLEQEAVELSDLKELDDEITELPVAAALAVIEGAGRDSIDLVNSSITVPVNNGGVYAYKDIHSFISGRCKMEVERLDTGLYKVVIHSSTCSKDSTGACSCGK